MALTQEQAQTAILREWGKWKDRELPENPKPKAYEAISFFGYLQQEKSELLQFRCNGDKWQRVKNWLANARLIES